MAQPAHLRQLVLGVLPSYKTFADPLFGHEARSAARRTWASASLRSVTLRFVVTPKMRRQLAQLQRRRSLHQQESVGEPADTIVLPAANTSSCKCAATMHRWFAYALAAWPRAEWLGKTEDDVYVQLRALHWELTRLPHDPLVWYGLMAWTGNGDAGHPRVGTAGCWGGGFEDDVTLEEKTTTKLLAAESKCVSRGVLAPSPTHELDVRGRGLAVALAACTYPQEWLAAVRRKSRRCSNDCAAVQGHWATRCVREKLKLAHATWTKVHSLAWTEAAWSRAAWSKAGDVDEDARTSGGWRFFAPPSNLSLAIDMNLRDRLLRRDPRGAWDATHAAMSATAGVTAFPALLYEWAPWRDGGARPFARPLNPHVARWYATSCRRRSLPKTARAIGLPWHA